MKRILVVEDEPQITQFLKRGLSYKGFEVMVASRGEQALHATWEYSPDLVVLDIMLPDIDGCEVCRRIRANGNTTLPILMLTAKDDLSDKIVGLDSGADDYITKPFALRQWQSSGTAADLAFFHQLVRGEPINEFSANPISIKVFDKQTGRILALSPLLNRVLLPFNHSDFEAALHGQHILSVLQDTSGNQVHALTFPLFDKIQRLVAVAQVSQSLQVVKQVQAILVNVLSIGGLIAVVVAYMASFLVTNRALRPLSRLISTMHKLSVQDMQVRFHPRILTTEVIQLSEAFNQMLDRLEASFALQRTFVADVSHELRTPLTAIQGHLDVLLLDQELDGIRPDLQQISAELRRLSRLVTNLLTTARAEAGVLPNPLRMVSS